MDINKEFFQQSVEKLDKADVPMAEIPDIELYMEQMTDFINKRLSDSKRIEGAPVFTKAMVNNYTKAGLLNPPNKKKYNKEHIILLFLMHHLKSILSITDIKTLFAPIIKNMDQSEVDDGIISLEDIYEIFLKLKDAEYSSKASDFQKRFAIIKEETGNISNEKNQDVAEAFLTVMMLVAEASIAKRLAEDIIDKFISVNEK
ncbi:MAG: DUF1836 domain-containing protein [Proteocatella sp.]